MFERKILNILTNYRGQIDDEIKRASEALNDSEKLNFNYRYNKSYLIQGID
jgi:hypothetical protein